MTDATTIAATRRGATEATMTTTETMGTVGGFDTVTTTTDVGTSAPGRAAALLRTGTSESPSSMTPTNWIPGTRSRLQTGGLLLNSQ